jgi:hypothetical protein
VAKKGLLDTDAAAGRATIYHQDGAAKFIESRQDCEHIVKAAQILSDEPPGKDFQLIGFIPDTVLNQMFVDGSFHDPKTTIRFLEENPAFRTTKGRL